MRIRTLAANILIPTGIALAVVTAWIWMTGDFRPSLQATVGLGLTAAGLAATAEWLTRHTVKAVRRRGRTARHRRVQDRPNPNPKTRKAA